MHEALPSEWAEYEGSDSEDDDDVWDGFGTVDLGTSVVRAANQITRAAASLSATQRIAELEAERIRVKESIADLTALFSSVCVTAKQAAIIVDLYPARVAECRVLAASAVFSKIVRPPDTHTHARAHRLSTSP